MNPDLAVLRQLEAFYDAVPRSAARVELRGPFALFVREGVGWPYYARPRAPEAQIGTDDVRAVLARQADLGLPQHLEWTHDLTPSLTSAAREAGMSVMLCPLLVLPESVDLAVGQHRDAVVELAEPTDDDLGLAEAVAAVAFGPGRGTAVGAAGTDERDTAAATADPGWLINVRERMQQGLIGRVVARARLGSSLAVSGLWGPIGVGGWQCALDVAEITGVATLPVARHRGIGAAVTAMLVAEAIYGGARTVFLSAQDDDVARVYERLGFERIGTCGIAEVAGSTH